MKPLARHLDNYLNLRRQLGYKLRGIDNLLRHFVRFAEQKRAPFITTKLAVTWATYPTHLPLKQKAHRLGVVRRFAQHLSALDPRTEIPAQRLLPYHCARRDPYRYRAGDILRLMQATREIDPNCHLKGASYATLIGLLAVTGMRVGEAVALDRQDVDLTRGVVTVRHAKGDKLRLVPLHRSSQQALRHYAALRDEAFPQPVGSGFFVSERGTRLCYSTVHQWFRKVVRQIGLLQAGDRHEPRLHDLRHHFAIETLVRWYRSKANVEAHLPELSTYLGHAHVRDTYWYLEAAPELLRLATQRCVRKEAKR
ncbi:MAG TPA: tyrosine-type recombinase/integrase [Verrucomicrobiota bacterium]|nr:tyrosine-type recombinase/integrase [Verrucomicrobiota bacterium]HRZ55507.1 tyrosine-type recombinase/integrase [Candidatus Paceibacterota bacterium]